MALLVGTLLLAVAPFGMALSAASAADNDNEGVCSGVHLDPPNGTTKTLTYTAPAGYLISGYCVKAGSIKQGDGPVYVVVDPPAASVQISHPSGKDISHYSVTLVPTTPPTTTPPTTTPPTTTPPTTTPPTTTPPTTTPPTTPPTTTPPTTPPTTTPPTTPPTTTPPTTPPTTTPPTPPVTVSASEPTPSTEVQGEQANEDDTKDKDKSTPDVEVLGEQAAVPTTVAAGLSGDVSQASSSSSSLWMAGMTGLLALAIGLGLVSSRRLRGRA